MKLLLGLAAFAVLGALVFTHAVSGAAPASGVVVQTTDGPRLATYSPVRPDPRLPTFSKVAREMGGGSVVLGGAGTSDVQDGHEARDAVRAEAVAALDALVSIDPCDPIRREAYLAATRRYIAAHMGDKADVDGVEPSGRWSTGADAKIGGSLNLLQNEGVISQGDMQRAMFGATWQGKLMLMVKPPPRALEERARCPVPS